MKKSVLVLALLLIPFLFPAGKTVAAEQPINLNILMYHHMTTSQSKQNKFTVLQSEFESDVVELKSRGYHFILMQDLFDYVQKKRDLPEKPIMLTFDDGYLSFYRYAFPVLKKHDASAVASIIGCCAELYSDQPDNNVNYAHMTWAQLKEIHNSPYAEVQNHTYNMHKGSPRKGSAIKKGEAVSVYQNTLCSDLSMLQNLLKQNCGFTPNTFTYPFGYVCDEALPVIKDLGFRATLTCWEGVNHITRNPECLFGLKRYNRASRISFREFMNRIEKTAAR